MRLENAETIRKLIKSKITGRYIQTHKKQSDFCRKYGIPSSTLCMTLKGDCHATKKLALAVGYERLARDRYRKIVVNAT